MNRIFLSALALLIAHSAIAQQVTIPTTSATAMSQTTTSRSANPEGRAFSVDFENTSLRTAIKTIVDNSGVVLFYSPEMLPNKNVTYSANDVKAEVALGGVLNVNGLGESLRLATIGNLAAVTSGNLRLRTEEAYSLRSLTSIRLPEAGYATANINASHRFSERIESTLQVTNLTNYYQNDFSYQYPALGRQTRLGARLRF